MTPAPSLAVPNRRAISFRTMQVAARITVLGEAPLDTPRIDLSVAGVSLISPRQFPPGLNCLVEIGIGRPELLQPLSLHTRVHRCVPVGLNNFRTSMHFVNLSADGVRKLAAMLR
jgi:hypothetical protein